MENLLKNKFVYFIGNTMYVNITNLCSNDCVFCIRNSKKGLGDFNPWLDSENIQADAVIDEIRNASPETRDEIVFCGYGEPLIKLDLVKQVSMFIKDYCPNVPVRVNSNGQANLIHKRNVVPELKGLLDKISVSLNAHNADLYQELSCCKFDKETAFQGIQEFMKDCQTNGIETTATAVSGFGNYEIDLVECQKIAESLGVKFKVREWLETGYE